MTNPSSDQPGGEKKPVVVKKYANRRLYNTATSSYVTLDDLAEMIKKGGGNGGVVKFGEDKQLYIVIGDNGRRGWMQNLPCGPTAVCPGPTVVDDQFGDPAPDNAHLTGVILRLNPDGTSPRDNPFYDVGAEMGGEVGIDRQHEPYPWTVELVLQEIGL